jgi:hypothetical protein
MGNSRNVALAAATSSVLEHLEPRRLFAAPGDIVNMSWQGQDTKVVAGEWIVSMTPPKETMNEATGEFSSGRVRSYEARANGLHAAVLATGKHLGLQFGQYLGSEHNFLLKASPDADVDALRGVLRGIPGFLELIPNEQMQWNATPVDPEYPDQWALNNTGQQYVVPGPPPQTLQGGTGNDIDAPAAWDYTVGSTSIVVAVMDSGMNRNHEDLAANAWTSPIAGEVNPLGRDVFNGDNDPSDDFGHGTRMAGIISGVGNNTHGGSGVNWNTRLMPVKVGGSLGPTPAAILAGFEFVRDQWDAGVNLRVVNCSFGGSTYSSAIDTIIDALEARNVLVVCAAGNAGTNNDTAPQYPASYGNANIVAVTGTNDDDDRMTTTNYGNTSVDIGAPGSDIFTTNWLSGAPTPNDEYASSTGSSPAAAMVSGAAALCYAIDPEATFDVVKAALLDTADDHATLVNTVSDGRVNAFDAVQQMRIGNGGANPADRVVHGDWQGAEYNDDIIVRANAVTGNAEVWRNQAGTWQRVTQVTNNSSKRINVFALRGSDTVTVENGVVVKVYAYGGHGTDNLRAKVGSSSASAGVVFYGGIHNDILVGSDFGDLLSGAGGDDILTGNSGIDGVFGEANNDTLNLIDGLADQYNAGSGSSNVVNKDPSDIIV